MRKYIDYLLKAGPKKFSKKVIDSSFGIQTLKRKISVMKERRAFLSQLSRGKDVHLSSRKDLQALLGAPALLVDPEIEMLQKYGSLAEHAIVEIGAAYGASSLLFLLSKKDNAHVFSIDPFVKDSMGNFQASENICRTRVTKALLDAGKGNAVKDWTLLVDYSFNVVKDWQKQIDCIFIDGDHRYEAVKQDFEEWLPFVKKGGHILFHDSCKSVNSPIDTYDQGWPGPTKLAEELKSDPRVQYLESAYSLSAFAKKDD